MNKSIEKINTQLDKATDFKYFALLASFVFFLDYMLITYRGLSINELSYSILTSEVNIGNTLIFFCSFAFLLSFFVPLVRVCLRFISYYLVPFKLKYFFKRSEEEIKYDDFYRCYDIKRYAIKSNNTIAYQQFLSLKAGVKEQDQLEIFCLSLLVSACLNWSAYLADKSALFSWFVISFKSDPSFFEFSLAFPFYALLFICLKIGVIDGGDFLLDDRGKYYMKNHGFRTKNET